MEIDVPGRDSLPPLRTAAVKKAMSGRVELGYTHTEELPAGGRQAQELLKALRSRDEQDADVYFTLKTRDGRGQEKELGQGFVNLHEMLKANKDVVQQGIRLHGKLGNVGTLAVSLLAVRAARALLEGRGAGGGAPARGSAAEFLDGLQPGGGGGGGVGGAEAEAAAAAGAGGAPAKEQELSLVAADPALAREGPGLVERFLLQPPAEGREGHADWDTHAQAQMERFREYLRHKVAASASLTLALTLNPALAPSPSPSPSPSPTLALTLSLIPTSACTWTCGTARACCRSARPACPWPHCCVRPPRRSATPPRSRST